ncbi:prenyltransferase/squalene oxidase repeat-containing protein [Verrucomicrobiales bacterium BCK34]|nr:prenyltransferase/squalene oxidase repeat-containing protein [Verrucomicrobiales bacterium BCK34]
MSLRLEMLQVARLAPTVLGEEASDLIADFVFSQAHSDGGFCDRDGDPDLYYTSFAIDALTALQKELPQKGVKAFLGRQLGALDDLDFVHLCCLARSASALNEPFSAAELAPVFDRIETYRTPDGGYNQSPDNETGSAYACFLAYGAYSDHRLPVPREEAIAGCLDSLQSGTGAWANDVELPVPNIPATAAAVTLSRNLRLAIPNETPEWILNSLHPTGGFLPFPMAPLPDLLSTAVALHALDGLQISFDEKKERILDFVDSLWTAAGGFHGNWEDDDLDIEYTYYGLLALGHLAL